MKKNTIIDGIAASEHLDSSGESLSIEGMDISSLGGPDSILNWEHGSKEKPSQVVGKVTFARKIMKEKDAKNKREAYFWNKIKKPFLYIKAELFDGLGHSGAQDVAAMLKYKNKDKGEDSRLVVGFSIEGGKIEKKGMQVVKSIARDVAITVKPCNKVCDAELIEGDFDDDFLYKNNVFECEILKKTHFDIKKENGEGQEDLFFKKPHMLFSIENPFHDRYAKLKHEKIIENLKNRGFDVEHVDGKYGNQEKSIALKNPTLRQKKFINKLAEKMGQDSIIDSDGENHKFIYLNGVNKGKIHIGNGTVIHKEQPEDLFSTTLSGIHFTHNIDFDTSYDNQEVELPFQTSSSEENFDDTMNLIGLREDELSSTEKNEKDIEKEYQKIRREGGLKKEKQRKNKNKEIAKLSNKKPKVKKLKLSEKNNMRKALIASVMGAAPSALSGVAALTPENLDSKVKNVTVAKCKKKEKKLNKNEDNDKMNHPMVLSAIDFAREAHKEHFRKYTGEPYFNHLHEVAQTVSSVPHSTPEMISAAYLHDTVEDTSITLEDIESNFGSEVATYVENLTDVSKPEDGNRAFRKQLDLKHSAQAHPSAKTIKLADLISNLESIATNDPRFSKTYIPEMKNLLGVLGDACCSNLYSKASNLLDFHTKRLEEVWGQKKMKKNEEDDNTYLTHYSHHTGLKNIDPSKMGTGVDSRTKGRSLNNKISFYYPHEYSEPEPVVTQRAKYKYTVEVPNDYKIFDSKVHGSDLIQKAKQQHRYGQFDLDTFIDVLQEHGYHGFKSRPSGIEMVGMFHQLPVHSEEK
jgi:hypothetical protein